MRSRSTGIEIAGGMAALMIALSGCDRSAHSGSAKSDGKGVVATTGPAQPADGHDHSHKGHAHEGHSHEGHGHAHVAPHGGALGELGDHFAHVELVHDAADGTITLYVLDGECEKPIRVAHSELNTTLAAPATDGQQPTALEISLQPVASALSGEKPGDTSVFRADDPALKGLVRFDVRIASIAVRGTTFENVLVRYTGPSSEVRPNP